MVRQNCIKPTQLCFDNTVVSVQGNPILTVAVRYPASTARLSNRYQNDRDIEITPISAPCRKRVDLRDGYFSQHPRRIFAKNSVSDRLYNRVWLL